MEKQTSIEVTNKINPGPSPFARNWGMFYKKLRKNKAAMVGAGLIIFFILVAIIGPLVAPYSPTTQNYEVKLQPPSAEHWLGTDHHGRDVFSRILHGTQITLFIGFLSVFIGTTVGVLLGIVSGYYGKKVDAIIMRFMDILLAFPGILLALSIVSVLGGSLQNVIIAISIFAIPGFARIVRGSTLAVKNLEYIDAVKALGASDLRIIVKHILPNILSPIIVQATLFMSTAILTGTGLSFLGMGPQPPTSEWGAMLNQGRNYMWNAPHLTLFPGLAIVLVVLAFNIFGDGLRDALDPKMKN